MRGSFLRSLPSLSLPARGEWIEMAALPEIFKKSTGLSPHGESGLKLLVPEGILQNVLVSPRTGRVD